MFNLNFKLKTLCYEINYKNRKLLRVYQQFKLLSELILLLLLHALLYVLHIAVY